MYAYQVYVLISEYIGNFWKYRNGVCALLCTDLYSARLCPTCLLSRGLHTKLEDTPAELRPLQKATPTAPPLASYLLRREPSSLHGSLYGHGAQFGRREGRQGTAETSDRGPHGAGNHHLVRSGPPPEAARRTAGEESAENPRPASSEC